MITAQAGKRVAAFGDCSSAKHKPQRPWPEFQTEKTAGLRAGPGPVRGWDSKKVDRGRSQSASAGLGGSKDIRAPDRRAK